MHLDLADAFSACFASWLGAIFVLAFTFAAGLAVSFGFAALTVSG